MENWDHKTNDEILDDMLQWGHDLAVMESGEANMQFYRAI